MADPEANLRNDGYGAPPADRVLELLYDRREGHFSRVELAAAAGLDAEGVAQAIEELRKKGFALDSSPAHGVRLVGPVPLCASLIERALGTRRVGRERRGLRRGTSRRLGRARGAGRVAVPRPGPPRPDVAQPPRRQHPPERVAD